MFIVLALTIALLLLLWVPFVCRFELKRDSSGDPLQKIEVRWLFLSRVTNDFTATKGEDPKDENARGKTGEEMDVKRIFEMFRTLHRPVATLARRVVHRIDFKELSCRIIFGLNDPADTGMLSGFLYAVSAPLTRFPAVSIRLHPIFHEPTFAYRVRGSLKVTFGRMVIPAIRFLCDRGVRGAIRERVRDRYLRRVRPGHGAREGLPDGY
ncbi:MAG: DUF2953 domain-containing protein [Methanosarcinales archaeon]|nr:MAG: DUF2953 domain-containing protein [Methanosarcinales archaeon]